MHASGASSPLGSAIAPEADVHSQSTAASHARLGTATFDASSQSTLASASMLPSTMAFLVGSSSSARTTPSTSILASATPTLCSFCIRVGLGRPRTAPLSSVVVAPSSVHMAAARSRRREWR